MHESALDKVDILIQLSGRSGCRQSAEDCNDKDADQKKTTAQTAPQSITPPRETAPMHETISSEHFHQ
jgi:hypothetical protein